MSGIKYYIDDLNTRFTNRLYTTKTRNINGLARVDVVTGIPYYKDSNNKYKDALFDSKYDLTLFYIESGERQPEGYGFQASVDLVVCANMKSFTGLDNEDLIEAVHEVMKVTQFNIGATITNFDALSGFTYPEKTRETMYPYFVFRIKTKITGILKQM